MIKNITDITNLFKVTLWFCIGSTCWVARRFCLKIFFNDSTFFFFFFPRPKSNRSRHISMRYTRIKALIIVLNELYRPKSCLLTRYRPVAARLRERSIYRVRRAHVPTIYWTNFRSSVSGTSLFPINL